MKDVFFERVRIYENVVHVSDGELIETFADDLVDVGLEGTGSVGETERHDEILEVTITSTECCSVFVSGGDTKPVECVADIDLGEVLSAFYTIEELRN